jgi:hypothetical protein
MTLKKIRTMIPPVWMANCEQPMLDASSTTPWQATAPLFGAHFVIDFQTSKTREAMCKRSATRSLQELPEYP